LMPRGRSSIRRASLIPSTAYLVAAYTPPMGNVNFPTMELRLTIVPSLSRRMPGRQARVTLISEKKLTSKMRLAASMETSSSVPRMLYPAF
ncbi:MAG TPA: hypothetical protein QF571_11585, partial [Desulfobacterales bacterium]|nr:hypothetical protein [Desulfobacterales bacterium]